MKQWVFILTTVVSLLLTACAKKIEEPEHQGEVSEEVQSYTEDVAVSGVDEEDEMASDYGNYSLDSDVMGEEVSSNNFSLCTRQQ